MDNSTTMADFRLGNFQSCCRLCLCEKVDTLKSVFDEAVEDMALPQKILHFVSVEITKTDKLSTMVCDQCIVKVNGWHEYKKSCFDNQNKLEEWFSSFTATSLADMSLQIKEEPMNDADDANCERTENCIVEVLVKNEPLDHQDEPMEEEYNELPPPLTPHPPTGTDSENSQESDASGSVNNRQCSICNKLFSNSGNRRKHERQIHGINQPTANLDISHRRNQMNEVSAVVNVEDAGVENAQLPPYDQPPEPPTPEQQKIQFAAGLKLLQKNSTPISCEPLSKIELSYIEKCKAMVNMHRTLECACHNVAHPNLKGLLSHLRALRIWFPVFTCYNCMITFTDRSTFTRHSVRCPKSSLETIVKLSNLKKRSEVKTRLYQNFKCTSCKFMYSFHDDFCKHVDEDHCFVQPPKWCSCGRAFENVDDYKDHVYVSCLVEYYCDICFVTTKTLEDFQRHSNEIHDNSEGFVLLQDDNYKMRKPGPSKSEVGEENVVIGKRERRMSVKAPIIERDDEDEPPAKRINPLALDSGSRVCPICRKEYSSHKNMVRHYKSHLDTPVKKEPVAEEDSLYSCPDCGGVYTTDEWQRHLEEHHDPKACDDCGKVFQFTTELDQHRSVHLNLKVYRDSKTQSYKTSMMSPGAEGEVMLMCEVCEMMFTSKEDLKQHKLTHENGVEALETPEHETDDNKYGCKECNKVYSSYGGIWDHNKKKHPEKKTPYLADFPKQCPLCDKVCTTGAAYYRHKQIHERDRISADNADATPTRASLLKAKDDEDEESYHTCKRCFKVFSSKYNLKNHMKSHGISVVPKKTVKKMWCEVCHQSFTSNEALERHKQEHNEEQLADTAEVKVPFIFTCDVCVMTFTTKMALKKHKEKHALETKPARSVQVYCKYCRIAFESVALLTKHMQLEHAEPPKGKTTKDKPKQFSCTICRKSFLTSAALSTHMGWHKRLPHSLKDGRPAKLLRQNKAIVKMAQNQVKQEPIDPPEFQCGTCLVEFPNDTALQVHILEKHRSVSATMLLPRCNVCNKDFETQKEYENHKLLHDFLERQKQHEIRKKTEQSPETSPTKFHKSFACKHCNSAFSRADTLNSHVRQCHKEQAPTEFACTQCDRVFDKQNSLSIHLKVHEKQKTSTASAVGKPLFSCSICSMGFDLPKDLRAHTISAHPF